MYPFMKCWSHKRGRTCGHPLFFSSLPLPVLSYPPLSSSLLFYLPYQSPLHSGSGKSHDVESCSKTGELELETGNQNLKIMWVCIPPRSFVTYQATSKKRCFP